MLLMLLLRLQTWMGERHIGYGGGERTNKGCVCHSCGVSHSYRCCCMSILILQLPPTPGNSRNKHSQSSSNRSSSQSKSSSRSKTRSSQTSKLPRHRSLAQLQPSTSSRCVCVSVSVCVIEHNTAFAQLLAPTLTQAQPQSSLLNPFEAHQRHHHYSPICRWTSHVILIFGLLCCIGIAVAAFTLPQKTPTLDLPAAGGAAAGPAARHLQEGRAAASHGELEMDCLGRFCLLASLLLAGVTA